MLTPCPTISQPHWGLVQRWTPQTHTATTPDLLSRCSLEPSHGDRPAVCAPHRSGHSACTEHRPSQNGYLKVPMSVVKGRWGLKVSSHQTPWQVVWTNFGTYTNIPSRHKNSHSLFLNSVFSWCYIDLALWKESSLQISSATDRTLC
jgi:hypothetical protein